MAAMAELMAQGKLVPAVEKAYPLEEAAEAFRVLEEEKVAGKVVLVRGRGR
jgi:D-arabinose 1-dehydrogenase-like Zn-dependent alcohol dehydrogenase